MPYPIVVYPTEEDGGYLAVVPDLPGCTAHGESAEEAVREAQVAMEDGFPIQEILPDTRRSVGRVSGSSPVVMSSGSTLPADRG